jgi:hypothetical protein
MTEERKERKDKRCCVCALWGWRTVWGGNINGWMDGWMDPNTDNKPSSQ